MAEDIEDLTEIFGVLLLLQITAFIQKKKTVRNFLSVGWEIISVLILHLCFMQYAAIYHCVSKHNISESVWVFRYLDKHSTIFGKYTVGMQ